MKFVKMKEGVNGRSIVSVVQKDPTTIKKSTINYGSSFTPSINNLPRLKNKECDTLELYWEVVFCSEGVEIIKSYCSEKYIIKETDIAPTKEKMLEVILSSHSKFSKEFQEKISGNPIRNIYYPEEDVEPAKIEQSLLRLEKLLLQTYSF